MTQATKDHAEEVKEYYGKTLKTSEDLRTNACCAIPSYSKEITEILASIHPEVTEKFYGCGLTIPEDLKGLSVLDLGSGSGRDCYLASKLVGEKGRVTGVDMTPEQLEVARRHIDFQTKAYGYSQPNLEFIEGSIEELDRLDFADSGFDLIISNCVINLVNDKERVLKEAFRVLKEGGELYFSDVFTDRRIPAHLVDDPVLYGECLSGALYWNDYLNFAKKAGFLDPRTMEWRVLTVDNPEIEKKLEGIKFYSVTVRLMKAEGLESSAENYGQSVRYNGGLPNQAEKFVLDEDHKFEAGSLQLVSGNTYRMLKQSRFAKYFDFMGDNSKHYGAFPGAGVKMPFDEPAKAKKSSCC